jgi:exosortase/archaeosortase
MKIQTKVLAATFVIAVLTLSFAYTMLSTSQGLNITNEAYALGFSGKFTGERTGSSTFGVSQSNIQTVTQIPP